MKVALACSGLGHVWRGYERFMLELHGELHPAFPVELYGGGRDAGRGVIPIPCLRRHSPLGRALGFQTAYKMEVYSFALGLFPQLRRKRIDILHYIDPALGNVLVRLRSRLGGQFRLLFTNGVGLHPPYVRTDHMHLVSPVAMVEAQEYGIPGGRCTFVPHAIHARRYSVHQGAAALRRRYGLPEDRLVVLSVSGVNRRHKRIDYLMAEFASLDSGVHLILAGQPEEPELIEHARATLGDRFTHLYLPFDEAPNLYRLADLFVLCSLEEGFGLSVLEALCSGLPVLVHRCDHFRWMVERSDYLVDMSAPGALRRAIIEMQEALRADAPSLHPDRARVRSRFDWSVLLPRYQRMYEHVMGARASPGGELSANLDNVADG